MAEPRDGSGIDFWGQDLLTAALGESGLNLEEASRTDFTSSEPVALSAFGSNPNAFQSNTILPPTQQIPSTGPLNPENSFDSSLDLNFDDLSDFFDEVNRYLTPHVSTVTPSAGNEVPLSQTSETGQKSQSLDFLNVDSILGLSEYHAESSSSTFSNFSSTNLTATTRTLLGLSSASTNANKEQENAVSKK